MLSTKQKSKNLGIVLIQEHNLQRNKEQQYKELGKNMGFTIEISFGRADGEDSTRGGVMTILDDKSVSVKSVIEKIPGFLALEVEWGAQTLKVANVYAPSQPIGRVQSISGIKKPLR